MTENPRHNVVVLDYAGDTERLFFGRQLSSDELSGLAGSPSAGSIIAVSGGLPGQERIEASLYDFAHLALPFRFQIVRVDGELTLLVGPLALKTDSESGDREGGLKTGSHRLAVIFHKAIGLGIQRVVQNARF